MNAEKVLLNRKPRPSPFQACWHTCTIVLFVDHVMGERNESQRRSIRRINHGLIVIGVRHINLSRDRCCLAKC